MKRIARFIGTSFLLLSFCACIMHQTNNHYASEASAQPEKNVKPEQNVKPEKSAQPEKNVKPLKGNHIYVNPATGNDAHAGAKPGSAKKTIQAAWDSLPALVPENVTIHLADGVYRESAVLKGKLLLADSTVTIQGNVKNPDAVRMTGSDGNSGAAMRSKGLYLLRQTNVVIEGIRFDSFAGAGIYLETRSDAIIRNCVFTMNSLGLMVLDDSRYTLLDSQFFSESVAENTYGIFTGRAHGQIENCSFKSFRVGINITHQSRCEVSKTTFDGCTGGASVSYLSALTLGAGNTISNSEAYGIDSIFNSMVQFATINVKYVNNKQNTTSRQGGIFCD